MMKEIKKEDMNPLESLHNQLWKGVDLFRGIVDVNEFHFILFLLTLQRKGLLKDVVENSQYNLKEQIERAINKLDADTSEELNNLLNLYSHTIRKIHPSFLFPLISFFGTLDQSVLEKHFYEIFDELLYKLSKWQGRQAGEFMLPMELSRFVRDLADLPPNAKIYNPFAGIASFGICLDDDQKYLGQEINHYTWAIGRMRIMAYNRELSSTLFLDDSIKDWNPRREYKFDTLDEVFQSQHEIEKFDLIVSNPPFGMRIPIQINGRYGPILSCEHFLIEKGIDNLKPDGKLIAVISQGFLFRAGPESQLRQHLIENDLIETVISLPGGLLMNTGIPVSILVINKGKERKGFVQFIDARDFVDTVSTKETVLKDYELNSFIKSGKESDFSKFVNNEAISEYDFNLSVPRYFQKKYEGVRLGELGLLIRGERISDNQRGKFIRIRDLKEDALDFYLNAEKLVDSDLPRQAQKIAQSCLLVASRWKSLKPTYFNYTDTPVYISPDILAFLVDESKCDITYLTGELHASYVLEQVESFSIGAVQPMIRREDLLSVVISLPDSESQESLNQQRAITKRRLEELANEKKRELILFNKIHGLESELIEQNTYLRHTLAGPTSNLKGSIVNIRAILNNQVFKSMPHIADLKVSEKHDLTLGQYLAIVEKNINKINEAVSQQLNVLPEIESKPIVPVEIVSFVKNFVSEYTDQSHLGFTMEFDYDSEVLINENGNFREVYINGNTDLLTDMFNNLINNAWQHAFHQYEGIRNIKFVLLLDNDADSKNEVIIMVSNSGNPFPTKFTQEDFIRKGYKDNLSTGEGYGGWLINRIVNLLNGTFLIVHEDGDNRKPADYLVTHFEFYFPVVEMN